MSGRIARHADGAGNGDPRRAFRASFFRQLERRPGLTDRIKFPAPSFSAQKRIYIYVSTADFGRGQLLAGSSRAGSCPLSGPKREQG